MEAFWVGGGLILEAKKQKAFIFISSSLHCLLGKFQNLGFEEGQ